MSTPTREPLVDGHGRHIGDLRISVTDRCSFRCTYCMPASGVPWLPREGILTFEEIERLAGIFVSMGASSIRLTGGEPLVRSGIVDLVARIASIDGLEDLALTTNGFQLADHAAGLASAGLDRINVSLDSLDHARFEQITRRDALDRVLEGLRVAAATEQFAPVKVNVVAMRGFTEHEAVAFACLARDEALSVRFIEYMPLDGGRSWTPDDVLTGAELRAIIEQEVDLVPIEREAHATARRFGIADSAGEIGFINPVSEPFCADCNRVRLTADGMLRTCLFSLHETDLRGPIRDGVSDGELERIIREAVWRKERKHRIGDPGFRQPARSMSRIGG
ncbi:MAG: GTP 3',8-cyclase MoaA [Thermoleophilia bacterium]|nr:GTP 3',8-cyclase MoaA [Thermoleophilia bacterium]